MKISTFSISLLGLAATSQAFKLPVWQSKQIDTAATFDTTTNCTTQATSVEELNARFKSFVQTLYVERNVPLAFNTHMSVDYLNHNPFAANGRQAAIDILTPLFPAANITVVHQGVVDGTGWVHYKLEFPGTPFQAVVDVFRYDGSCIVEHWDVAQSVPANATNPAPLF